jgi:hypothetical protein
MTKPLSFLRRFLPEVICLAVALTLITTLNKLFPRISDVSFAQGGQPPISVTLPLLREASPGLFEVSFTLNNWELYPAELSILPDDCLDAIYVDGQQLITALLPYCDLKIPINISLRGLLHPGANKIRLQMRNLGWPAGVAVNVSWKDPVLIAFIVCSILLFYLLWIILKSHFTRRYGAVLHRLGAKSRTVGKSLSWMCLIVCAATAIYAASFLIWQTHFDLFGIYTADTPLYWMVGRGIIAGFNPYVDFFETKPPGIFLLSALSYGLVGTGYLTNIASFCMPLIMVISTALIAVVPVGRASVENFEQRSHVARMWFVWSVWMFSILMALYTWYRSGAVQVEAFGAVFATFYACLLFRAQRRGKISAAAFCWLTIFAACSVGFKEPFALAILAVGILLVESVSEFIYGVICPLIAAALLGLVALYTSGYLSGYIDVYLPEMLFRHVPGTGPVWLRGLRLEVLWRELQIASLSLLVLLCMSSYLLLPISLSLTWVVQVGLRAVKLAVVCYLASLSVGLGGAYYNHHFVFPVPIFIACSLVAYHNVLQLRGKALKFLLCASVTVATLQSLTSVRPLSFAEEARATHRRDQELRESAQKIDEIMDSCGYDRYLYLGGNGPAVYQFTKHLPMGPFFFQYGYFFGENRPDFRASFLNQVESAPLIVERNRDLGDLRQQVDTLLLNSFTPTPPTCAGMVHTTVEGHTLLWRTSAR